MKAWYKDLIWSWRGVTVRETGAKISFNLSLVNDLYVQGSYTVVEKLRNFTLHTRPIVAVYPNTIRPWYLLWAIITRAGVRLAGPDQAQNAVLAIHFEDKTETMPPKVPIGLRTINFECTDISKSNVANTFKSVFGYDLSVDPEVHNGLMVRKSEENGSHSGKVTQGPCKPEPGWVYQKVVNNRTEDNHVADLRCPTLFGTPALVFIKERPFDQRFDNLNTRCTLKKPEELFSQDELTNISRFCHKMKLDFGGLDILRDKEDGRIYIVDVNKTDMGPPFALSLREKLKAVDILANQFKSELLP